MSHLRLMSDLDALDDKNKRLLRISFPCIFLYAADSYLSETDRDAMLETYFEQLHIHSTQRAQSDCLFSLLYASSAKVLEQSGIMFLEEETTCWREIVYVDLAMYQTAWAIRELVKYALTICEPAL